LLLKELNTKEMLAQFDIMQHLYTNFSLEKYESYLDEMVPHNYKQIERCFEGMFVWFSGCGLELSFVW
jgi:hypothetical protein